ncbi:thioredoxin family protein [Microbacterium sp. Mcb102]|uniref:thioredoxin family protein n=1 Tax=Microbacterium sp. Mcb102 TaxID=2926012 RepID=UPI0021CA5A63|nr:thioredoxin family protein [Microbacterium sp. Mcb102]
MEIELLHIADCPSWVEASRRVAEALRETGHDGLSLRYRLIRTEEDAAGVQFAGSPTITVDGNDLFPGSDRSSELACRIYSTPAGLAGMPTVEQIREAMRAYGD